MPTINHFKELQASHPGQELSQQLVQLTQREAFLNDWAPRSQSNRSVGSGMDHIAEGIERRSTRELFRFLAIAGAAAGETRSQKHSTFEKNYLTGDEMNLLPDQIKIITSNPGRLMKSLRDSNLKRTKFMGQQQESLPRSRNPKPEII